MKITGRDIIFFALGLLTFLIIDSIINWEDIKKGFNNGFDNYNKVESEK